MISFCIGATLVVGTFVLTALIPMDDPRIPSAAVEDQQFWELPTGSRISYVHLSTEDNGRKPPVIFLHGGPGVPDMKGDSKYFGQLTQSGFDVYVYDEVGSGRSSRLVDPRVTGSRSLYHSR